MTEAQKEADKRWYASTVWCEECQVRHGVNEVWHSLRHHANIPADLIYFRSMTKGFLPWEMCMTEVKPR